MMSRSKGNSFLVIFDFDGVIADSKEAYTAQMRETLESFSNISFTEEEIRSRVGNTDQSDDFKEFLKTDDPQTIDAAIKMYSDLTGKYAFLRSLFPNVTSTLDQIKRRHFTGIVSRKSQERMEFWLNYFKISQYFDYPIGTLERTKATAIQKLMNYYGIPTERTLMIGDTEFDIKSAKRARVISVAALYDNSEPQKLLALSPDYTIDKFEDILTILDELIVKNSREI